MLRVLLLTFESFVGVWFCVTWIAYPIAIVVWCSMDLRLTCDADDLRPWRIANRNRLRGQGIAFLSPWPHAWSTNHVLTVPSSAPLRHWFTLLASTSLSTYRSQYLIIHWTFFLFGTNHKFHACFINYKDWRIGRYAAAVLFRCRVCTFLLLN